MYRVVFHNIDRFLKAYESSFEREYGYLHPIVQEVVDKYLDCGNPNCGFAQIRCHDCSTERLLMFSCKTRGFCQSCHAKRRKEWGGRVNAGRAYTGYTSPPGVLYHTQDATDILQV